MPDKSQSFALINKIKSLVKTGSSFLKSKKESEKISREIALKIQKNAFDLIKYQEKSTITPPLFQIAEQLQVDDENIVKAATFALVNIANTQIKYKAEILNILNKTIESNKKSPSQVEYIKEKIKSIK